MHSSYEHSWSVVWPVSRTCWSIGNPPWIWNNRETGYSGDGGSTPEMTRWNRTVQTTDASTTDSSRRIVETAHRVEECVHGLSLLFPERVGGTIGVTARNAADESRVAPIRSRIVSRRIALGRGRRIGWRWCYDNWFGLLYGVVWQYGNRRWWRIDGLCIDDSGCSADVSGSRVLSDWYHCSLWPMCLVVIVIRGFHVRDCWNLLDFSAGKKKGFYQGYRFIHFK